MKFGSSRPRIALWFQGSPWPARSGVQLRVSQVIEDIESLGWDVRLFSSTRNDGLPWTEEAFQAAAIACRGGVRIAPPMTTGDRVRGKFLQRLHGKGELPFRWHVLPSHRSWFHREIEEWKPQVGWFNHVTSVGLLECSRKLLPRTVVDVLDIVSRNRAMTEKLSWFDGRSDLDPMDVPETLVRLDMFDSVPDASAAELADLAKYDVLLGISPQERRILLRAKQRGEVVPMPVSMDLSDDPAACEGGALFPTGPNAFNLQGYAWFVQRILPELRRARPEFEVKVCGYACDVFQPSPGVVHLGTLPSIEPTLMAAGFVIVPVWGGTGQQIKIVEAAAMGLPVVSLRQASRMDETLRAGVMDCEGEEAFVLACLRLWDDLASRREHGGRLRRIVAKEFSRNSQAERISGILGGGT